jgi:hypothetical protein
MTLEPADGLTEQSLMQVRDRTLAENYEAHDVAQEYFEKRCKELGITVVQHGDDARHADDVFFGDGPDTELRVDDERRAYTEVKSKRLSTGAEWFGRLNRRHYEEYQEFAREVDVPVVIFFALVEEQTGCIHRQAFVRVDPETTIPDVYNVAEQDIVFDASAIETVDGSDDLRAVPCDAIQGVRRDGQIVDHIPSVKGNDVVAIDSDEFRSWPWLVHSVIED